MNIKQLFSRSLRFRMTTLLAFSVIPPMLLSVPLFFYAEFLLLEDAQKNLASEAQELESFVKKWEENQILFMRGLRINSDILSMDPTRQKPILTKLASLYGENTIIATVDSKGKHVARSTTSDPSIDFSDRKWFKEALAGKDITKETLISRKTGKTEQCFSTPIQVEPTQPIIGVIVMCTELAAVSKEILDINLLGSTGEGFLVNKNGTVIAHSDNTITDDLHDWDLYPPVKAVSENKQGLFRFIDTETESRWLSYLIPLSNGGGIVVQQQEEEVLGQVIVFAEIAIILGLIAAGVVGTITWLLASRLTSPILQLTATAKSMSGGNLDSRVTINRQDELGTLAQSFNSMAEQLQELIDIRVQSAMARSELEKGRKIQQDFLPESLPQPQGWEIATFFEPAREVAGDFYDAFTIGNDKIALVIADVCDKGVGSALFMALFRSLLRAIAQQDYPSEIIALKNAMEFTSNYIATNHSRTNMFATIFFAVLDPKIGLLNYINGGHEPPVIISPDGKKQSLKPTGPAVGILPNINFKIKQARFMPGDTLFAYTDGVPDARSPQTKFFSEKHLLSLLEPPITSANALLDMIQGKVKQHIATAIQFDDITMLAIKRL